ncbi:MAG TPA: hypothetical protein VJV87_04505 [Sphingomicrobium sp.]|nr:hypothetical protein [Sphingomicrobium sp.]
MLYHRVPRLLDALALARGDGRYTRLLKSCAFRRSRPLVPTHRDHPFRTIATSMA